MCLTVTQHHVHKVSERFTDFIKSNPYHKIVNITIKTIYFEIYNVKQ